MDAELIETIVQDVLWLLVAVGWIFLLITGLEADKPLSGGIPGHFDVMENQTKAAAGRRGRLGEVGAWVVFGLVAASLPVILWWIFLVHPR
jgi:hypothetical protein